MEAYKDYIANCATICSVGQFLTGSAICRKLYTAGNTKDFSPFPFLAGVLSCGVWLKYGMLINDSAVMTVNLIGFSLQLLFLGFYYRYTLPKGPLNKRIFLLAALFVALFFYADVILAESPQTARESVGLMACVTTVVFCASPLSLIAGVFRTRSTEFLPLPLIFSTWVVTGLWWIYGMIIDDFYVQLPNMFGCLLAGAQLCLFLIFPRKRRTVDDIASHPLLHVQ